MRKWQKVTGAKELRQYERRRGFVRATMITAAGPVRAFVRNLSCGGALLDCAAAAAKGDRVRLCCEDLLAEAMIAWRQDKQIGLQFAEPLSETLIAEFMSARPHRDGRKRGKRPAANAHPAESPGAARAAETAT